MAYNALADLVVLIHLAFIGFVLVGGLLALRWRWFPWVHLPAAAWGAAVEMLGWYCPLTPLENALRRAGGDGAYSGGFVARYLLPIIYPEALTRELQLILGCAVIVLNLVIYLAVWRRRTARTGVRCDRLP
jgi:hypothetical protein